MELDGGHWCSPHRSCASAAWISLLFIVRPRASTQLFRWERLRRRNRAFRPHGPGEEAQGLLIVLRSDSADRPVHLRAPLAEGGRDAQGCPVPPSLL